MGKEKFVLKTDEERGDEQLVDGNDKLKKSFVPVEEISASYKDSEDELAEKIDNNSLEEKTPKGYSKKEEIKKTKNY